MKAGFLQSKHAKRSEQVFQWFLWPCLGSHKSSSLLLYSPGLRDLSWLMCWGLFKVMRFIRGHFGGCMQQFSVSSLCVLVIPSPSWVMPLVDSVVIYPLNSPLLRFTKVGKWPTQGQACLTSSNFIPAWKDTDSKDLLSKSSNENRGGLSINFSRLPWFLLLSQTRCSVLPEFP